MFDRAIQACDGIELADAPAVITIVEQVGSPVHLHVKPNVKLVLVPQWITLQVIRDGCRAETLRLEFDQRQQQTRADGIIARHVIHYISPAPGFISSQHRVILQPAGMRVNEGAGIEVHLCRSIDEKGIRQDLERIAPQRLVINGYLQGFTRCEGGGILWNFRIGFQYLGNGGIEMCGERRDRVSRLCGVCNKSARVVDRAGGQWGGFYDRL